MRWKCVCLFIVICALVGCGYKKEAEMNISTTTHEQYTDQTGLPSGMIQQTQVFYNDNLYKLYLVDNLSELPPGFIEAGSINAVTPYNTPGEELVGAGPDVYEGQKVYSCPDYNSAILLQNDDRYITLMLDQLDMVLINDLELIAVKDFLLSVDEESLIDKDQYIWTTENMIEVLKSAADELTTEIQYAWIDSVVDLKFDQGNGEDTLRMHFGKTDNIIYIQLITADKYLYRAICTSPDLFTILRNIM